MLPFGCSSSPNDLFIYCIYIHLDGADNQRLEVHGSNSNSLCFPRHIITSSQIHRGSMMHTPEVAMYI